MTLVNPSRNRAESWTEISMFITVIVDAYNRSNFYRFLYVLIPMIMTNPLNHNQSKSDESLEENGTEKIRFSRGAAVAVRLKQAVQMLKCSLHVT